MMTLSREDWVLIIVGQTDYIEGATRLQKYAFLIAMSKSTKDVRKMGFYNDWKPSKYGPFSGDLADDIRKVKDESLIQAFHVINEYGYRVDRFALTEKGRQRFQIVIKEIGQLSSKIKDIVINYNKRSLMDVLSDVYYLYPNYAIASVIKPEVDAKRSYESELYLNPEWDDSA